MLECSDPKFGGLPDGREWVGQVSRHVMKQGYIHRYDFDRRCERVVELGNNRNGSRTTGAGTKWGTGIMLVVVPSIRLRGRSRQNHSYPQLPNGEQRFICTRPKRQTEQIDGQYECHPLHGYKGTVITYATGSQKENPKRPGNRALVYSIK